MSRGFVLRLRANFWENLRLTLRGDLSSRQGCDNAGENDDWDSENPLNAGLVTVNPSAPAVGTGFIYLPVVAR